MIISLKFEGDNITIQKLQHDLYGDALNIILRNNNNLALFAKHVMKCETDKNWGVIHFFDHRVLQEVHDILAGVWRYKSNSTQISIYNSDLRVVAQEWLSWLDHETYGWIRRPDWVRLVQDILLNSNTDSGYKAETSLCNEILDHFHEVPWFINSNR